MGDEMEDRVSPVGDPPEWLNEEGRAIWSWYIETMGGDLQERDRPAFILLCATGGIAMEAEKDLHIRGPVVPGRGKEAGGDAPVKNPSEAIARQQTTQFRQLANDFGLTPGARKRLRIEVEKLLSKAEAEAAARIADLID